MSALVSRLGADCSLVVSPLNVNVWLPEDKDALVVLLPDMDGFNKLHGTATCLPELDEVSLVLAAELVGDVPDADDEPAPLREMTANSTRPELGLIMTSLIVPRPSPDEDCTCELLSCDARMACWPMERPVALKPLLLLLPILLLPEELSWLLLELPPYLLLSEDELLPGEADAPDEPDDCACAVSTRHAVQNANPATICFLIFTFLFVFG
jgi:hypothetical protein